MLNHFLGFVIVGAVLALAYAGADKLIAKIENAKTRKYIRIAVHAILLFCGACIVDIIVTDW